jgi:16S rRNA processing protein RimM
LTDSFLSLGRVVGTHGLKGGMKVYAERGILSHQSQNLTIRFEPNLTAQKFKLSSISKQKLLVLKFEEISTIDEAEKYVGKEIYLLKSEVPPTDPDEMYEFHLIGLTPHEKGKIYSDFKITSILENPAHPILEFSNAEAQVLIPYIQRYVGKVDLDQGLIEVHDWEDWIHAL